MDLGYIITRSPHTPHSLYLRGTIGFRIQGSGLRNGNSGFMPNGLGVLGLGFRDEC